MGEDPLAPKPTPNLLAPVIAFVKRFPFWTAVGVFALVGYLFRDYFSGSVADLKPGDCFDVPAAAAAAKAAKDVQHHPCTEAHEAEVIFIGTVAGTKDAYPEKSVFLSFVKDQCIPAFRTYTGVDFDTDTTYDLSYLFPLADGWANGDRTVDCFAVRIDGGPMKGSIKAR